MSIGIRHAVVTIATLCVFVIAAPFLRADAGIELKGALVKATVKAIELEIDGYRGRLATAEAGTGPKENVERFKKRLEELQAERLAYGSLKPEKYPDPGTPDTDAGSILDESPGFGPVLPSMPVQASVVIDGACADGTLLSVEGATRSGPFYHVAGIEGNNYGVLKQGQRYRLTLYLVYKREYFGHIADYYVYIAAVR